VPGTVNVPAKNLKELIEWLKANPVQTAYGTPAAGSLPHFFAVLFARETSIDLRHVAYKGNSQAITDLIGGHLPMFFTSTQDLVEAHNAGRIRVLATWVMNVLPSCVRFQPSWRVATAFGARAGMAFMLPLKRLLESSPKASGFKPE
jgi:tripartite-type tricarboxylate transporter receptor subunit TctC